MGKLIFTDDRKKYSYAFIIFMVFATIGSVLFPVTYTFYFHAAKAEIIKVSIIFPLTDLIAFFAFLYCHFYKLEVYEDAIKLRTLYRKIEINLSDIERFSSTKYGLSTYYMFKIYTKLSKPKSIVVYTKHYYEFTKLLSEQMNPKDDSDRFGNMNITL